MLQVVLYRPQIPPNAGNIARQCVGIAAGLHIVKPVGFDLSRQAAVKKNTKILHHMMGCFKEQLHHDKKKEMIEVIEEYHRGLVPLVVPIVLVRHYVRKYDEPYLERHYFLNPHQVELMLRNHV
jgi:uncharacterized protein YbgA (DUF1722 family)